MATDKASEPSTGPMAAVHELLAELGKPELHVGENLAVMAEALSRTVEPESTAAMALHGIGLLVGGLRSEQLGQEAELIGRLASFLSVAYVDELAGTSEPAEAMHPRAQVAMAIFDAVVGRRLGMGRTSGLVIEFEGLRDVMAALDALADVSPATPEEMAGRYDALAEALKAHGFDAECARWLAAACRQRAVPAREGS